MGAIKKKEEGPPIKKRQEGKKNAPPKKKQKQKTKASRRARSQLHYGNLPCLLSHNRAYKRRSQSLPWPEAHFASAKPSAKRLVCPTR
jgi:hypothetical protein